MIKCENKYCQYHDKGCTYKGDVTIGLDSKCDTFKEGLPYYLTLLPRTMESNFLTYPDLTYDLRCSIYYLMKCIPLSFAADENRGIIYFKNTKTGKKLINSKDIWDMIENDMDEDKVEECYNELLSKGLPTKDDEDDEEEKEVEYKEYGWLSPKGEYYEAEFGDHEKAAHEIITKNNWYSDYYKWLMMHSSSSGITLMRDYLSSVKGYALIHDPSGLHRYIVSHTKPLTKKQKEFLYGFFIDMNMRIRAEEYIDD